MLYENHVVEKLTPAQAYFIACDKKYMWFCAGRGCFLKNTKVRMYDSSVKNVQDIIEGDVLMGDDLTPRNVMSTVTGREEAYRVQLEDNTYYDCNISHDCIVVDEFDNQLIKEVSVKDILINGVERYSQMRLVHGKPEKLKFNLYRIGIEDYFGFNLDGNNRFLSEQGIFLKNSGKCFQHGTKMRMFDGSVKEIQDIVEGEYVMGWDSTPRKVVATCTGVDEMYEIKPKKSNCESHIVNSEHMMCLYKKRSHGLPNIIVDISVKDFLTSKNKDSYKLFRSPVMYPERKTFFDPYIAGAWMGDGYRSSVSLAASPLDTAVSDYWNSYFSSFGDLYYRRYETEGCVSHTFTVGVSGKRNSTGQLENKYLQEFRRYYVNNEKRIDSQYLFNSENVRLQFLAGLIDTDGYKEVCGKEAYTISTIYDGLRDDIILLAQSLGFQVSHCTKNNNHVFIKNGVEVTYNVKPIHVILISGNDIDKIPCKLPRKIFENKKKTTHKYTIYGFDVIPKGKGVYYGIETEGDGRILLDNGIVTRNTTVGSYWVYKNVIKYPRSSGIIAANSYAQLHGATIPPILAYFRQIGLDFRINKRPPESWLKRSPLVIAEYKGVLTFETGAHVFLRSLDNYDLIRGISCGWIWIDEIASTSKEAWDVTIGCLRDKNCDERHVRVTGTPDGPQWTWEEFKKKWSDDPLEAAQYDIVFMSARENPFLPPDFLDGMLSAYDRRKALQEIDGRILADQASSTYYEYRPDYHKRLVMPYDPNKPIVLCWDFNATKESPLSMEVCQRHEYSDGTPFVQVIDEFIMPGGNTPAVCEMFLAKYKPLHKSKVYVYGDRTGNTSTTGTTDYQQVKERIGSVFELENRVSRSNMAIKQRVGSVNGMLLNTKGQVRLFISPVCVELLKDLEKVQPGKFDIIDKSDPARTHASDALGYFIGKEFPVVLRSDVRIKNINVTNLGHR